MRVSNALERRDGTVHCRDCDARLCAIEDLADLKALLAVNRHPVSADPIGGDTDQFVDERPEIAEYCCPECGSLIDTEVTVSDTPISGQRR